jgi:hypothetical protein
MVSYDKSYFLNRFDDLDTEELLQRLMLKQLCDEALDAIREILERRGVTGHALELQAQEAIKSVFRKSGVTNQCDCCGKTGAWTWVRDGMQKFCGQDCLDRTRLLESSMDIPFDVVLDHAKAMTFRPCPACQRSGTRVEMRRAHYLASALWFMHVESPHALLCRRCGRKRNILAAISCFVLGWWSLWGFAATPIFVVRNIRVARR